MTAGRELDQFGEEHSGRSDRAAVEPLALTAQRDAVTAYAGARAGARPTPGQLIALQRTIGNAATSRLVGHHAPDRGPTPGGRPRIARFERESEILAGEPGTGQGGLAEAGELAARERLQSEPPPISRVSNVHDVSQARRMADQIRGYDEPIRRGMDHGNIPVSALVANDQAVAALNDYLITAGEQGRTLSDFQRQVERVVLDWSRVMAQVNHLRATGAVGRDAGAAEIGEQMVRSLGFEDPGAMASAVQDRVRSGTRGVGGLRGAANQAHRALFDAARQVTTAQFAAQGAVHGFQRALQNLASGVTARETDPETAKSLSDIRKEIETVKRWVGLALDLVKEGAKEVGPGVGKVAGAAAGVAKEGGNLLVDSIYDEKLTAIQNRVTEHNERHRTAAISANLSDVRAAKATFLQQMNSYVDATRSLEEQKNALRSALRDLGDATGGPRDDRFSQVAVVLAEVDSFVVQADMTIRLGEAEQNAARDASAAAGSAFGPLGNAGVGGRGWSGGGMPYYEPYQTWHAGRITFKALPQRLALPGAGLPSEESRQAPGQRVRRSADAEQGVNPRVQQSLDEIRQYRDDAAELRRVLSSGLGLAMNEPGLTPGPTAPSPEREQGR